MFGKKTALHGLLKQRLVVTCKNGLPMFSGVLLDVHIGKDGVHYQFADVKPHGSLESAVGTFWIDKSDVAYMQEGANSAAV